MSNSQVACPGEEKKPRYGDRCQRLLKLCHCNAYLFQMWLSECFEQHKQTFIVLGPRQEAELSARPDFTRVKWENIFLERLPLQDDQFRHGILALFDWLKGWGLEGSHHMKIWCLRYQVPKEEKEEARAGQGADNSELSGIYQGVQGDKNVFEPLHNEWIHMTHDVIIIIIAASLITSIFVWPPQCEGGLVFSQILSVSTFFQVPETPFDPHSHTPFPFRRHQAWCRHKRERT